MAPVRKSTSSKKSGSKKSKAAKSAPAQAVPRRSSRRTQGLAPDHAPTQNTSSGGAAPNPANVTPPRRTNVALALFSTPRGKRISQQSATAQNRFLSTWKRPSDDELSAYAEDGRAEFCSRCASLVLVNPAISCSTRGGRGTCTHCKDAHTKCNSVPEAKLGALIFLQLTLAAYKGRLIARPDEWDHQSWVDSNQMGANKLFGSECVPPTNAPAEFRRLERALEVFRGFKEPDQLTRIGAVEASVERLSDSLGDVRQMIEDIHQVLFYGTAQRADMVDEECLDEERRGMLRAVKDSIASVVPALAFSAPPAPDTEREDQEVSGHGSGGDQQGAVVPNQDLPSIADAALQFGIPSIPGHGQHFPVTREDQRLVRDAMEVYHQLNYEGPLLAIEFPGAFDLSGFEDDRLDALEQRRTHPAYAAWEAARNEEEEAQDQLMAQ